MMLAPLPAGIAGHVGPELRGCTLPDERWLDATRHTWRNGRGRPTRWPDIEEVVQMRRTRVIPAAAHFDHDPGNNWLRNLKGGKALPHIATPSKPPSPRYASKIASRTVP